MSEAQEQSQNLVPPPDESTPLLHADRDTVAAAETMSSRLFWRISAIYGATAVGLGAFGAHGLKSRISDPQKLTNWSTAAHYQMLHAAVLLIARHNPVASSLFTAGMTMFSGSIYALVLDGENLKALGPVTPLGGLCLIAGWLALGFTRGGAATALRL